MIESLESRVLMHAADLTPGFNALSVVLNSNGTVQAARAEVDASRAQLVADTQNAELAVQTAADDLNSIAATGKAVLKSDKSKVAATRGDATANAEARQTLAADQAQLKANLAEAKATLKTETANAKALLKSSRADVKGDEAALKLALKASVAGQKSNLAALARTLADGRSDGLFSDVEIDALAGDLTRATVTANRPNAASVSQLASSLAAVATDAAIPAAQMKGVLTNLQGVLNAATADGHDVSYLIDQVVASCANKGASDDAVLKVAQALYNVYFDFAAQV